MERVLPVQHFHVVFTVPSQLRPIARANPAWFYKAMFDATRITLMTLGKQRLGGDAATPVIGVTAVLHTWTKDLHLHPHVHCVVTAGGLDTNSGRWSPSNPNFLFPVAVMRKLFRGILLKRLKSAVDAGDVHLVGRAAPLADQDAFTKLLSALYRIKWVVYAKKPFAGPGQVFKYLGRYTHRVAISDSRLLNVNDDRVVIRTRGDGSATMTPAQFVQRFLLHILPSGFHKIRHFGLYSPAYTKQRAALTRELATTEPADERPKPAEPPPDESWQALVEDLTGVDLRKCPRCDGAMKRLGIPRPRGPPGGS